MKIVVNKELASFFPLLSWDQKQRLEASLLKHGQEDLIKIGHIGDQTEATEHFIIDGHNRYEILNKHGIDPQFYEFSVEFEDLDDAKIWMIEHQLGRRELEPYARAEYAMKLKTMIETRQGRRTDLTSPPMGGEVVFKPSQQASDAAGIGLRTLERAQYISEHADEETKEKLRHGMDSIRAAYERLKKPKEHVDVDSLDAPMRIIYKEIFKIEKDKDLFDEDQLERIRLLGNRVLAICGDVEDMA
jgi:hypothetical protein